ncbi:MAG: hypothetical protein ABL949_05745 [Fimbriimonadaceae bacterium]
MSDEYGIKEDRRPALIVETTLCGGLIVFSQILPYLFPVPPFPWGIHPFYTVAQFMSFVSPLTYVVWIMVLSNDGWKTFGWQRPNDIHALIAMVSALAVAALRIGVPSGRPLAYTSGHYLEQTIMLLQSLIAVVFVAGYLAGRMNEFSRSRALSSAVAAGLLSVTLFGYGKETVVPAFFGFWLMTWLRLRGMSIWCAVIFFATLSVGVWSTTYAN